MLNSLELFCGAGGLALGLQKAGIAHEGLFEWDKTSCNNIQLNINRHLRLVNDWRVYNMDVRKIDYAPYKGRIDIVSGGPPCQPFSVGGLAKAYNDKRDCSQRQFAPFVSLPPKRSFSRTSKDFSENLFQPISGTFYCSCNTLNS